MGINYIEFVNRDENIDFDEKMKKLQEIDKMVDTILKAKKNPRVK